ncbi:MAG: ATP-binding protein [Desulfobacterales bacterium]|nr:ATP-binding protein [Desulfobacterales bacterium]
MNNFERSLVPLLVREFEKKQHVFQVLTGPRQVGKTTIAHQVMDKLPFPFVYASADSPLPPGAEWIETQWRRAEVEADRSRGPVFLVLDEVQKVRGWSESLKSIWDAARRSPRDIRLLVLGSSALLIREGLSESLAGRFFLHRCSHWTFQECVDAFGWDLPRWLYFGGYPGAAAFSDDEQKWKRYVTDSLIETVLARDVLQLQKITKPTLLRHLFALAATFPAQILSYNKMLGQLHDAGNTTTLAHYLRLLETAFLVSGLELFSRGSVRKRGSSPKLLLWNNALVTALSNRSFNESNSDAIWWGRLVENAVGGHLVNNLYPANYSITYWRHGDNEVDFVIARGTELCAIEVKSGRSGKVSGLEAFRARYPDARLIVVGGNGIPLHDFFSTPAEAWL